LGGSEDAVVVVVAVVVVAVGGGVAAVAVDLVPSGRGCIVPLGGCRSALDVAVAAAVALRATRGGGQLTMRQHWNCLFGCFDDSWHRLRPRR